MGDIFDVLVVGAGPSGSTIARLFTQGGARVFMVDPHRQPHRRLELVAPRALPIFEELGLSDLFSDERVSYPCLGIRKSWGRGGIHVEEFLRDPGGRGYVIDRGQLDATLLRRACDAGVHFERGAVTAVRMDTAAVVADIYLSGITTSVRAPLVVDATGRSASIARRLGARRAVHEHLLASMDVCAQQPASAESPWLDVNRLSECWQYSLLGPRGARQFWSVQRGKGALGRSRDDRHYCDASSTSLEVCAGSHWLAIGDAAAAYDPISSQGLATALSGALAASKLALSGGMLVPSEQLAFSSLVARTHARTEASRRALYSAMA